METKAQARRRRKAERVGRPRPTGAWIRKDLRLAIYLRDGFRCVYCGRDLHGAPKEDVTLDHVYPYSEGGENLPSNLVTACKSCNSQRGTRRLSQYADLHTRAAVRRQTRRAIGRYRNLSQAIMAGEGYEADLPTWDLGE